MHWDGIVENLKDRYRVVIPNISHLFLSPDQILFSGQVEVLTQYLRAHFPNEKVNLAGTSYGGALAWAVALDHPELVENLILVNPMVPDPKENFVPPEIRYFFASDIPAKALNMMLNTPIGKALLRRFATAFREERTRGVGAVENLKGKKLAFVGNLIYRFIWILRNENWKIWQQKIEAQKGQTPCLLIYDREDKIFSADTYKKFGKDFECVEVKEITGAGHLAIKVRPDSIANNIHSFLDSLKTNKKSA